MQPCGGLCVVQCHVTECNLRGNKDTHWTIISGCTPSFDACFTAYCLAGHHPMISLDLVFIHSFAMSYVVIQHEAFLCLIYQLVRYDFSRRALKATLCFICLKGLFLNLTQTDVSVIGLTFYSFSVGEDVYCIIHKTHLYVCTINIVTPKKFPLAHV